MNQELVKQLFTYKDGALYWKVSRGPARAGARAGWRPVDRYRRVWTGNKNHLEHRLIFLYHNGYLPDVIDHIDRNPENNCISNLREATQSLNIHNQNGWGANGSKGVYLRRNGKYGSGITKNGKQIWLGTFDTISEASKAYDAAAKELYG